MTIEACIARLERRLRPNVAPLKLISAVMDRGDDTQPYFVKFGASRWTQRTDETTDQLLARAAKAITPGCTPCVRR